MMTFSRRAKSLRAEVFANYIEITGQKRTQVLYWMPGLPNLWNTIRPRALLKRTTARE